MNQILSIVTGILVPAVSWVVTQIIILQKKNKACDKNYKKLKSDFDNLYNSRSSGFISWHKDNEGKYKSINTDMFMKVLMPLGLKKEDIIGKKDIEIKQFSPQVNEVMRKLYKDASAKQYAVAPNLKFHESLPPLTVIKTAKVVGDEIEFIALGVPNY